MLAMMLSSAASTRIQRQRSCVLLLVQGSSAPVCVPQEILSPSLFLAAAASRSCMGVHACPPTTQDPRASICKPRTFPLTNACVHMGPPTLHRHARRCHHGTTPPSCLRAATLKPQACASIHPTTHPHLSPAVISSTNPSIHPHLRPAARAAAWQPEGAPPCVRKVGRTRPWAGPHKAGQLHTGGGTVGRPRPC